MQQGEAIRAGKMRSALKGLFFADVEGRIMHHLTWTGSEKKIARRAYEYALEATLAKLMADFKARAAAVTTPAEMWAVEDFLRDQRREIDELFDYRYSQLPLVFARLIGMGRLDEARLSGLSEEKLEIVRRFLSWHAD